MLRLASSVVARSANGGAAIGAWIEDGEKGGDFVLPPGATGAWMISAAMTGAAGGLWAYWITFIETSSAFDIGISVRAYIMMLLGGMGTVLGPILGAAIFEIFATVIWSNFSGIHNLLLGALIVLIVLVLPSGLIDTAGKLLRRPASVRQ